MSRTVWAGVGAVCVALAVAGWAQTRQVPRGPGDAGILSDVASIPPPAAAPALQESERIPVTVRGKGIRGVDPKTLQEKWSHDKDGQALVLAPGLARDPAGLEGKIGLRLGPGNGQGVAIDSTANLEGDLVRIHVDSPGDSSGAGGGQLIVIGVYDGLDSYGAIIGNTYACKRCGQILVCGVNPQCF